MSKIKGWKKTNERIDTSKGEMSWRRKDGRKFVMLHRRGMKYQSPWVVSLEEDGKDAGSYDFQTKKEAYNFAVDLLEPSKEICVICDKPITKNRFSYKDRFGRIREVYGLCNNPECVDEYSERFGSSEPSYDVEARYQDQQDDLWERSKV